MIYSEWFLSMFYVDVGWGECFLFSSYYYDSDEEDDNLMFSINLTLLVVDFGLWDEVTS